VLILTSVTPTHAQRTTILSIPYHEFIDLKKKEKNYALVNARQLPSTASKRCCTLPNLTFFYLSNFEIICMMSYGHFAIFFDNVQGHN